VKMSDFLSDYARLSRVSYAFRTIGDIFLKVVGFTSVIKRYVCNEPADDGAFGNKERQQDVEEFALTSQSLLFLNPGMKHSLEVEFKQFHDFTLKCNGYSVRHPYGELQKVWKTAYFRQKGSSSSGVPHYARNIFGKSPGQGMSLVQNTRTLWLLDDGWE